MGYVWTSFLLLRPLTHQLTAFREVPKLDPNTRRPSNVTQVPNPRSQGQRFEETYILEEVEWLKSQANVQKAAQDRGMQIHAFVYDKEKNTCFRLVEEESRKS